MPIVTSQLDGRVWCSFLYTAVLYDDTRMLYLSRLEEKNGNLSQVEVNKMFRLVCDVTAEVPSHNAMPRGVVLLVEFLLDVSGNVFFDVEFFESLSGTVDGILLHVLRHISVLHYSLSFSHCAEKIRIKYGMNNGCLALTVMPKMV